jgi:hypothetical protein
MPQIQSIDTDSYGQYFSEEFNRERSSGCHLMQIVEDLDARLTKKNNPGFDRASLDRFATLGFIWERLIGRALSWVEAEHHPERIIRPGEQFLDGVYATPDAFNTKEWRLEEWKCTWRRAPKSDEEFEERHWKWLVQSMAYCHILGCTEAMIRVFYIMGDWKLSDWSGPLIKSFRIISTPEELEETWRMVLNHRTTMERDGIAPWLKTN